MGRILKVVLVLAVAGGLLAWWISRGDDDPPGAQSPDPRMLALGDSYISGEGAGSFEAGTNLVGSNECRRAATSYPYLLADTLGASVVSLACSGAKVDDVSAPGKPMSHDGQYPNSPDDIAGGEKQLETAANYDPDVVVLSLGGNDIGFAQIVQSCVLPSSCLGRTEEYFQRIVDVEAKLRPVYKEVMEAFPEAELYVVTYPMPVTDQECRNAHLSQDEFEFVDEFVHYLDQTISVAASAMGAHVVNIEDTFEGHQICDPVPSDQQAMNSLVVSRPHYRPGDVRGWFKKFSSNFHNSYHPTPLGHQLIAGAVLQEMADAVAEGPDGPFEEPFPEQPPSAPPWVPNEIGPPEGPYEFPQRTGCDGDQVATNVRYSVASDVESTPLTVTTEPGSTVCFRAYKERWKSATANQDGILKLTIQFGKRHGVPSIHEILYQSEPGTWVKAILERQ